MITEKSIRNELFRYFSKDPTTDYLIENVYVFEWESDFLVFQRNKYITEFEVKISKADFRADFSKEDKHLHLKTGLVQSKKTRGVKLFDEFSNNRPNKFYYIAPTGIINVDDVPEYAGLMEITPQGYFTLTKKAPFIHKEQLELSQKLVKKFYYKWANLR